MTLTVTAGNRQMMAKNISTSPRGNFQLTAKILQLNSVPVFPPGYVPKLVVSAAAASSSSECGSETNLAGMSTAPITLRTSHCNTSDAVYSTGAPRDCINSPMNIVRATPEPYLEPIKLLNKQSVQERQQSPAAAPLTRSNASAENSAATAVAPKLRQVTRSCFTGTKFPSPSSRPIPPPKVLLKRQPSTRETVPARPVRSRQVKTNTAFSPTSAKRRELAYLIVDLESGRTAIGTKSNRALDDSNVGLRVKPDEKFKFPVRSFTMSVPGDQIKRPVVKPRPTRYTSSDSIKEETAESADVVEAVPRTTSPCGRRSPSSSASVAMETLSLDAHREQPAICVNNSAAGSGERKRAATTVNGSERTHLSAPPPVPPKRGLAKMVSLPPGANGLTKVGRLQRDDRPLLSESSLAKDLQNVNAKVERESRLASPEKSANKTLGGNKPVKNRVPPPRPKPYSERIVTPPPPPSFPPPPRPTAAKPTSPPATRKSPSPLPPPVTRKISSPVPPAKPPPTLPNLKTSRSHQTLAPPGASPDHNGALQQRNRLPSDSKLNKTKRPKPPPPSRPPPANTKITQLIQEHRSRSTSTIGGGKGQSLSAAKLKLEISEPRLISTTMRSENQSLTDLRTLPDRDVEEDFKNESIEEDDLIACSNISYVATADLFAEDSPSPLYEDIDSVIPLPPPRTDAVKPTKVKKSISTDSLPPELPPKGNSFSDPIGRRRVRRSPPALLPKTLNTSSSCVGRPLPSPDSPTDDDKVEPYYVKRFNSDEEEGDEDGVQDTGDYEPIRSPLLPDNGEEGEEPDVGGVEEYVAMGSVISGAWETDDKENSGTLEEEDHPEDSYVEMQPVSVTSPSPTEEDISRNTYELDDEDEPEPVYIEMNPAEFVPPKSQLHYATKNLLTNRPDLQTKDKKKAKKLFGIRGKR